MNSRKILPYLVAILSFLAVCLVYFAPVIEGRRLPMHDITQYEGMRQDILEHQKKYDQDPQWAGRLFSGMPSYLISIKYESMILRTATWALEQVASPASLVFLAMLGFFIMVLLCGINPWVGIIPSLAYGLSTYFFLIIGAGHITKMVAMAYVPMMMGGVFYAYRTNMWLGAALTALFASIEISASHPQITYYFGIVLLAYWINELCMAWRGKWMPRFLRTTGLLLVAGTLALGSNSIALYNVQQYSKHSIRGGSELKARAEANPKGLDLGYATAWSYGVGESLNLFIPNYKGGASTDHFSATGPVANTLERYGQRNVLNALPTYWGDQPMTGGPTYLGAVALFLAVAAMFLLRGRHKWWILAVSLLALALAWGSNMMWLTRLFFDNFPGYNKFRTVSMILVVVQWSVPLLAAMFLYSIWKGGQQPGRVQKAILNSLYVTGGIALFALIFAGSTGEFTTSHESSLPTDLVGAMRTERVALLRGDAWRSLLFVGATALVCWLFASGKLKRGYSLAALAALVCMDLIPVNARYLPQSKFVAQRDVKVRPSQADLRIMEDTSPGFRVANFAVSTFNDASTSYFHRSVGGYHGAKLQRYQDVIERYLASGDRNVYNMLNTQWYIVPDQDGAPQAEFNPDAWGAAWFTDQIEYYVTPDEQIDALKEVSPFIAQVDNGRDARRIIEQAGVADMAVGSIHQDTSARIRLVDYRVNRLTYRYFSSAPRVAIFSEIYYPDGWTATIDGKPLEYFRANYLLRAAALPEGEHTVVFSFAVPHYKLLSGITLACSLLIIAWVIAAIIFTRKKSTTQIL